MNVDYDVRCRASNGNRSMSSRRVAAIDCGTNSIRLLVAEIDPTTGHLTDITRRMKIVRLGEDLDRTGHLSAAALSRTLSAVDEYAATIAELGAQRVRFVATSATRDADNRSVFVDAVRERLGVEPEVVSGSEEASLSFVGATAELVAPSTPTPLLVVDIGGGSTEFVMGDLVQGIAAATSVDIGCVRLTERHFLDDPPYPAQVSAARDDIDVALAQVATAMPLRRTATLVGLAGSVTTVAALAMRLWEYDPSRIHGARISAADIHRTCEELIYATHEKRVANPAIHPGRVDVIAAGSLVLSAVVAAVGVPEVIVSEHDILDGIARSV
jgi:exopolyphosphatase/guanosine-5'-triphosphate,3'-diphosphate pyrophosphatase